jgi:hypothetical protein
MAVSTKASGAIGGAGQGAAIGFQMGGPYGAAVGAVIGGVGGLLSGGAEDDAQKIAEKQIKVLRATTKENLRRARLEMAAGLGATEAGIAASNILNTGSSDRYMRHQEAQYRADMSWETNKARMEEELLKQGGQIAASQIQSQGLSSMMGGLTSAAQSGALGTYKDGAYKPPWQS